MNPSSKITQANSEKGLKQFLVKHKVDVIALALTIILGTIAVLWATKIPWPGGVADFNVYLDACRVPNKTDIENAHPIEKEKLLARYGAVRVNGEKINQVRIDMLSLLTSLSKSPLDNDAMCVLREANLVNNSEFMSDIRHFGQPLGNLQTDSSSFRKTYSGPDGTKIKAWLEMPNRDNMWQLIDGIDTNATRELILEINP